MRSFRVRVRNPPNHTSDGCKVYLVQLQRASTRTRYSPRIKERGDCFLWQRRLLSRIELPSYTLPKKCWTAEHCSVREVVVRDHVVIHD